MKKTVLFIAALLLGMATMVAKVTPAPIFADDMVLQQKTDVALWGTAKPDSKVVITTTWSKAKTVVNTDADGKWKASVSTPVAGGPYEITFNDGEKLTLKNVLIGEVWFCSGQSNMEMPMKGWNTQPVEGYVDAVMTASPKVPIRACKIPQSPAYEPQANVEATWYENTPAEVGEFSAVAYFFAKRLNEILGVPVGVIDVSWGGSRIEAWMSPELLKAEYADKFDLSHFETKDKGERGTRHTPALLYNGMIHPLIGYTIKGFLWYQGCSNAYNPRLYVDLQPSFVKMLREKWGNENLPFYFTQIAQYKTNIPEMMWAQALTVDLIPHCSMAATHDVGEYNCIHPAKKKEVGDRLANLALSNDYGFNNVDVNTPIASRFEFKENEAIVYFDKVSKLGLSPRDKDLDGFELAGEDGVFYPAKAIVLRKEYDYKAIKVYQCPQVTKPVAVRYAWSRWSPSTLYNCYGIPASPFTSQEL